MLKKIILLFLVCGYTQMVFSQKDTVPEPYIKFNAVSIMFGFTGNEFQSRTNEDFQKLAPNNSMTYADVSRARKYIMSENSGNALLNIGANVHFKTKDLKTSRFIFSSEWRIGLNLATMPAEKIVYGEKLTTYTDTFYSNHTSMIIYEDKNIEYIHQYKHTSSNAYLDISKTYHTDQKKGVSFYTGLNVGIGYTFNNYVHATAYIDSSNGQRGRYRNIERNSNAITETTKLRSEIYYNASMPIGILLRLSKKKKKLALTPYFGIETRLGYRFQKNYSGAYQPVFIGSIQFVAKVYLKNFHQK